MPGSGRFRRFVGVVTLSVCAAGSVCLNGCRDQPSEAVTTQQPIDSAAVEPGIKTFCGDCHAVPPPETFPREAWYAEVSQGFQFYYESGRTDLQAPAVDDVVAYYRSHAPEMMELAPQETTPGPLRFERFDFGPDDTTPAISHLNWLPPTATAPGELLASDMRSGTVREFRFDGDMVDVSLRGTWHNPAHVTRGDLDQNGREDLLVADLGSFQPADHENGRVIWLRPDGDTGQWDEFVIHDGCGRIADIQLADFDGDDDLDLVVAEFGWRKTGQIVVLQNTHVEDGIPHFQPHVVDDRHGTIHVPVVDLNQDARPDFVALVSQEFEVIDAFLSQGDGTFARERVFDAQDPAFGSSGIQLVDLDLDGDMDVLYTNGDTLDSHYLKPSHGVHWLENRGEFPFTPHRLAQMPGVCRALAADLDLDGDLDIAACAAILHDLQQTPPDGVFDSLLWLEQVEPGQFVRHSIGGASGSFVALSVGDFNGDGTPDLATGRFAHSPAPAMTFWWNRTGTPRSDGREISGASGSSGALSLIRLSSDAGAVSGAN